MKRNHKLNILLNPYVGTTDLTKSAQIVHDFFQIFNQKSVVRSFFVHWIRI